MILPSIAVVHLSYQYLTTGRTPQILQGDATLYRTGNYVIQHHYNANPDNFWDKRGYCWTSDPNCGLEVAPKRPWEDLKEPTKVMVKFHRDASVSTKERGYNAF